MPNFLTTLLLTRSLCYHALEARIRFQEEKLGGIFPGA